MLSGRDTTETNNDSSSLDSNSISLAASKASLLTLQMGSQGSRSSLLGNRRRGGVSVFHGAKKVKRPLKLVPTDEETLKELEGEVPLEQWQNELSHLQMALGVDNAHSTSDFALTTMRLE